MTKTDTSTFEPEQEAAAPADLLQQEPHVEFVDSDSQAALKVLSSPKVTSGLVAERLDVLFALASLNKLTFVCVPGHCGIPGNEEADKLARQVSAMLLLGPELTLGIPRCLAREAVKICTEYQHYIVWKDLPGHSYL
jgi:hypothetical protein